MLGKNCTVLSPADNCTVVCDYIIIIIIIVISYVTVATLEQHNMGLITDELLEESPEEGTWIRRGTPLGLSLLTNGVRIILHCKLCNNFSWGQIQEEVRD
jgi:hypothetical protein